MLLLLICLASMVVVELTGLAGLVEALKESDLTENFLHTLLGMVFLRGSVSATCLEETENLGASRFCSR